MAFTLRLPPSIEKQVAREAKETGRSKHAQIVETLRERYKPQPAYSKSMPVQQPQPQQAA